MTMEQYNELLKVLPQVEAAVKEKGDEVVRPVYEDQSKSTEEGDSEEDNKELKDESKSEEEEEEQEEESEESESD